MKELQKLGLQRVIELLKEIESDSTKAAIEVGFDKKDFDSRKHADPFGSKARECERWINAILSV